MAPASASALRMTSSLATAERSWRPAIPGVKHVSPLSCRLPRQRRPLMSRILIVDDDGETCRFMAELLERPDREIRTTQDANEALTLAKQPFELLISDINLDAQQNGMDVLRVFKQANPRGHVVLISGFGTLETAIDAVRAGAFDYISKPFNISEVKATVERALSDVVVPAGARPSHDVPPPGLIGRTAGMLSVYKQIAHAANASAP